MGLWLLDYTGKHLGVEYGMMLAASLGLRAGEIRGLTWDCFSHVLDREFDQATITVKQRYDRDAKTGEWRLMEWTKGKNKSWREIAIPAVWASDWFELYLWQQDNQLDKFGLPFDYRGYCFLNTKGGVFTQMLMCVVALSIDVSVSRLTLHFVR